MRDSAGASGEGDGQPTSGDDDPSIPSEDHVYRRLSDDSPNMLTVDSLTGIRRPSSGSFKPDADGVSVYRERRLQDAGLSASDVIKAPINLVASVLIADIRSLPPLGVRDDPWPIGIDEPTHPRNVAHALIVGWTGMGVSERRRLQKSLVALPSMRLVYP